MRVEISCEGAHDPPWHLMQVDNHSLLIDLTPVYGTLLTPEVLRVTWGPIVVDGGIRECGYIFRNTATRPESFWDKERLRPYLNAFEARKRVVLAPAPAP